MPNLLDQMIVVENVKPGEFEVKNFEEFKTKLTEEMNSYVVGEVNEDTYKGMKEQRAFLNKLSKTLDDRRKDFQKRYLEPFNVGKKQYDELISIVKAKSDQYGVEISKYDDLLKNEKKESLKAYFNRICHTPINFEQISKDEWYNKSTKEDQAKDEILLIVKNINLTVTTILNESKTDVEFAARILSKYFKNLDLEKTFNEIAEEDSFKQTIVKFIENKLGE